MSYECNSGILPLGYKELTMVFASPPWQIYLFLWGNDWQKLEEFPTFFLIMIGGQWQLVSDMCVKVRIRQWACSRRVPVG